MRNNMNKIVLIAGILILILISSACVLAKEDEEGVSQEDIEDCLNESEEIMFELQEQGFNIFRVNDTLIEARDLFEIHIVLKERGRNYNFESVLDYCILISFIQEQAYDARAEFLALIMFYNESFEGFDIINTSSVDVILEKIEDEIFSERYEKVFPLIDSAYNEIGDVKARHTALVLFYTATTKGLKSFFMNNWIFFAVFFGGGLIFYIIFRKPILKRMINNKLLKLDLRKKELKKLIQKNQRDYFEKGIISESAFVVKSKRLGEMIRDLDRQIPLLNEQLAKLRRIKSVRKT